MKIKRQSLAAAKSTLERQEARTAEAVAAMAEMKKSLEMLSAEARAQGVVKAELEAQVKRITLLKIGFDQHPNEMPMSDLVP